MADSALAVVACALVLAGCGGSPAPSGESAPAPPRATATAAAVKITITRPRAGATVPAGAPVAVAGRATPGTTVLLSAGCAKAGCRAIARADEGGLWHGRLIVAGARAELEASTPAADVADTVKVRVAATARTRTRAGPPLPGAEPTAAPRPAVQRVVLVGDSLAVGIEELLPGLLPGMRVQTNALTSRPLAAGMKIVGGLDLRSQPTALAVSLFTNDDPRDVGALEAAVRSSATAVGPGGCVVWATIARPPFGGVSYRAANARLGALEGELANLVVVPWAEQVAAEPALLGPDGVHATPAGYRARAALYAQAVHSCA